MYRCVYGGECCGCGECQAHHTTDDEDEDGYYDEDFERDLMSENDLMGEREGEG